MKGQDERDRAAEPYDEIATLARAYLIDSDRNGLEEIDRQCAGALAEGRWDDLGKWHRVRLRYMRFRQQRDYASPTLPNSAAAP